MEARRDLQGRPNLVERQVRADPVERTEENEVVALSVVSADVAEGGLPEVGLTPQIVDAQNDRADAEHLPILSRTFRSRSWLKEHSRTLGQRRATLRAVARAVRGWAGDPANLARVADRILVYGVTGSGKTSIAERISTATTIPWYSVDDLTWEPGWKPVAEDEQRRRIAAICAGERWVLDTAYGVWLDVPLARVQVIVALDFPRWLSLFRLIRRSVARAIDGQPICNGNRESFRLLLSADSIIVWHFRSFGRKRRRIREWEADPSGPIVIRLTSPHQVDRLLATDHFKRYS